MRSSPCKHSAVLAPCTELWRPHSSLPRAACAGVSPSRARARSRVGAPRSIRPRSLSGHSEQRALFCVALRACVHRVRALQILGRGSTRDAAARDGRALVQAVSTTRSRRRRPSRSCPRGTPEARGYENDSSSSTRSGSSRAPSSSAVPSSAGLASISSPGACFATGTGSSRTSPPSPSPSASSPGARSFDSAARRRPVCFQTARTVRELETSRRSAFQHRQRPD